MAEKRRDNKNRVLKTGESQRKDGRYMYKYTDLDGKVRYEYSWKLVPTDKMPAGKRDEVSLREKIKEVEKRLEAGLVNRGADMTVLELIEESLHARKLRDTTLKLYEGIIRRHISLDPVGKMQISCVRKVTVKEFGDRLEGKKLSKNTASNVFAILSSAFAYAQEEEIVKRNPFYRIMRRYEGGTDKRKVDALTPKQQESLLRFLRNDPNYRKYADGVELLLETGLRIGEMCGLTLDCVDMKNKMIMVKKQMLKNGTVTETKTPTSVRSIPMSERAYTIVRRMMADRTGTVIRMGRDEPLLLGKNKKAVPPDRWNKRFQTISKHWMETDRENGRYVTPHMCRHTYCTNLVQAGVNPKAAQYLMGHSQLSTTMNIYANNNTLESAVDELKRLSLTAICD